MIKLVFYSDFIKIFVLKMDVFKLSNHNKNLEYDPINIICKRKPVYYRTYLTWEKNSYYKQFCDNNLLISIRKQNISRCVDNYVYNNDGEICSENIMKEDIIFKIHRSFIEAYFIFIVILINLYKNVW